MQKCTQFKIPQLKTQNPYRCTILCLHELGAEAVYFYVRCRFPVGSMEIIIDNSIINLQSEELLQKILSTTDLADLHEILISGHADSSMTVLTSENGALLMFLREKGNSGFTSRSRTNEKKDLVDFKLSNGQLDEYPTNWLVGHEEARRAIVEYKTGQRLDTINWMEE